MHLKHYFTHGVLRAALCAILVTGFPLPLSADTILSQPLQDSAAQLYYYNNSTNEVDFTQGAVMGTVNTLRLWLQATTTRPVYLGWKASDGGWGNVATATVSGGNVWQWIDFDLTWSNNSPTATSSRTFVATSSPFGYIVPSWQTGVDVFAGCLQATSSYIALMGNRYAPQCGTPTFELLGTPSTTPTSEATTSTTCTDPAHCASSVLFLPGIEASRLYRPDYNGGEDQLWEPNTSSDVTDLYLDDGGKSIRDDIYTRDVIDEANVVFPEPNIYKTFLHDLTKWRDDEHLIDNYAVVPYDWRLSLDDILGSGTELPGGRLYYSGTFAPTTTPYIIQTLRQLASTSKTKKVTIIAHSNGGLLAKALIKRLQVTHDPLLEQIDVLVFVASPQTGTPQAIGALLHGYDQGIPLDWFSPFLDPVTARTFASTSPMAYHLLPSAAYFSGDGAVTRTPPVVFDNGSATKIFIDRYGHAIGNITELHDFLLGSEGRSVPDSSDLVDPSVLKPVMLSYGEGMHARIDDAWTLPTSLRIYQIAGWGNDTLSSIRYFTGMNCVRHIKGTCTKFIPVLEYTPEEVVDGDGTVIEASALAMSTSTANVSRWWVDLATYNTDGFLGLKNIDREHKDILEVPELRSFIKENILANSTTTLPDYISSLHPVASSNDKRLRFILHSPLTLSAHDVLGNRLDASTSTIPGGQYKRYGEVQVLSVPASALPTIELLGFADGSFTLEVEERSGDTIIASTTFTGIPSATGTVVTMEFPLGTIVSASPLSIDYDHDGVIDLTLSPVLGDTVMPSIDDTPPELAFSFATSTNSLMVLGVDTSSTTVTTSATSTIATDAFGNTTRLTFSSFKEKHNSLSFSAHDIQYNENLQLMGTTTVKYKWDINKRGEYTMFITTIITSSTTTIAHYYPKRNITIFTTHPTSSDEEDDDNDRYDRQAKRTTLSSMVIPGIRTQEGKVAIFY